MAGCDFSRLPVVPSPTVEGLPSFVSSPAWLGLTAKYISLLPEAGSP
jgi:hypothetical protein